MEQNKKGVWDTSKSLFIYLVEDVPKWNKKTKW